MKLKKADFPNLTYVEDVATTIALTAKKETIVVTKSTVPVGTNDRLLQIIDHNKLYHINYKVVSKLKFLSSFGLNKIEFVSRRKTIRPHLQVSLGSR